MTFNGFVNVIIPAAGRGSRFSNEGWKKPKPFIDVNKKSMLEHVIKNISPYESKVHLLLNSEHINAFPDIVSVLSEKSDNIIEVSGVTEGTACTVLLAKEHFNNDIPMMVGNSDQLVDFDINEFIFDCFNRNLDGSILVFKDIEKNPKWSFTRCNLDGLVVEVAEKKPISDLATVGIYLFSKGSKFVEAAEEMIAKNDKVNNEFYTCPVYNYMIKKGARIGVFEVPMEAMHGIGTPKDLTSYLELIESQPSIDRPDI